MKLRKVAAFALTMVFALSLAASGEGAKISFKLGHSVSDQHPYHLGAEKFKELIEKESGGEIEIALFPNNQLGTGERDLLEGLQLGTVDIYVG